MTSDPFEASDTAVKDCIGWHEHDWKLSIVEGRVNVTTEACGDRCEAPYIGLGDYLEYVEMAEIPVQVRMATDCPAYDTDDDGVPTDTKPKPMRGYAHGSHYIAHGTRCDCNWWPVLRAEGEQ